MIAAPHYRSLPGLGRRKEGPCYTFSMQWMTRHHHPAQALGATGGLAALVGWVPTAVSARSAYKVKGEVPEGLLRRSSLEATERGGYVEKLVKQVRMAAASVGTCTI